ncbi:hypothetical protein PFISCL1PPCAC_24563, partial [Pristionchus fissidentatus]
SDPIINFLLTQVVSMQQQLGSLTTMVNNMFLSWNDLIIQSANRSTGAHQELAGTKQKLEEVSTSVAKVETVVLKVAEQYKEDEEFDYAPYSTKADIDGVDNSQKLGILATDIERLIYTDNSYDDRVDLQRNYKDRLNRAKAKWLVEVSKLDSLTWNST